MKTKTLKTALSIFIAFSLALSSCDKKNAFLVNRRTATPEKIEEIKSINYLTTLVKDLHDNVRTFVTSASPDHTASAAEVNAPFAATERILVTTIKAIKHAYAVVNRPALVNKTAFVTAKDFTAAIRAEVVADAVSFLTAVRGGDFASAGPPRRHRSRR